jgi:hypothetical protein
MPSHAHTRRVGLGRQRMPLRSCLMTDSTDRSMVTESAEAITDNVLSTLDEESVVDAAPLKADKITLKGHIWSFLRTGSRQIGVAAAAGLAVILLGLGKKAGTVTPILAKFGNFFTFLVGLGATLILISSLTMAFLLYALQAIKADRGYLYGNFRAAIVDLRNYLYNLHEDGRISAAYQEPFLHIEQLTQRTLPGSWNETIVPFAELIRSELQPNRGRVRKSKFIYENIFTRLAIAEEAVQGLGQNLVQRITSKALVSAVVKSLCTLAVVIIAVIVAAIHFRGLMMTILNGIVVGIGCMTILLLIETGLNAIQESSEFFKEYLNVSGDDDDEL